MSEEKIMDSNVKIQTAHTAQPSEQHILKPGTRQSTVHRVPWEYGTFVQCTDSW